MRTLILTTILCVTFVLAAPGVTEATILGTIDVVYTHNDASDVAQVWAAGSDGMLTEAGVNMLNKTAGTGQGNIWANGPMAAFCIELNEVAPPSTCQYDTVMPQDVQNSYLGGSIGVEKANYLRELWGRFYDPSWTNGSPTMVENYAAESFAVAIWEIIYEDLPTSSSAWNVAADGTAGNGGFSCHSEEGWGYTCTDIFTANNWLHQLDGTGPMADLRALVYCGQQDYLVQVPEPTSIILLGLGGVLSLMRKKKAIS